MCTKTIFALAGFMGNEDKIDWLKSLKGKIQPKQEWSEKDDLSDAAEYLREYAEKYVQGGISKQYVLDLARRIEFESLRPRSQWKPSEEQVKALEHFVRSVGESGYASLYDQQTKLLYSLLEQLKQL